jgi:hypothetical protein
MIMRKIEKGEGKGTTKVWSYPGMEKLVQMLRKKIEGVSGLFTLDACRHGCMTELEEAELTRDKAALSLDTRPRRPIAAMPRRRCSALWPRPASGMHISWRTSSWKNKAAQNF